MSYLPFKLIQYIDLEVGFAREIRAHLHLEVEMVVMRMLAMNLNNPPYQLLGADGPLQFFEAAILY